MNSFRIFFLIDEGHHETIYVQTRVFEKRV